MPSERIQRQIDILFEKIEAALDQPDWIRVRELADGVLKLDPDNEDALAFIAAAQRDVPDSSRGVGGASDPAAGPITSSAPVGTPASFANGRYEVERFLGEGGKKLVYLAKDTLLDRDVAFALIKAEGLDKAGRTRISREAQAMGRLGAHPHIVTVFDLGEHDGQPYMVTELMGGGDVEGLVERAPEHRVPIEQAVDIAKSVCRGLAFAHSHDIIHRDLKPGNVWLTGDGVAKIGDFGLAVATDRSRLTQEGMMVGTVSYMPPEQAMGGEVTPRADLYSLGAMLYEMVTGRPPFLGDDSVAIIGQHINTPPVAPTWHNPLCPRPLAALIQRLLAKDPAERPESAADVLAALETMDLVAAEVSAEQEAHSLDSLAGGVFVGRQREMGELKAALEDALSGRGRLVMLVGEPGIGKTRTALELSTYAGLRKAQVLWGRCYEGGGAPPYWPWVQAIRSYARDQDSGRLQSEMGSGGADIAEIVSDVRDRLPDLKPPPALGPEQARFRLFDSITTFLKAAGRRQPLVLILDDLHWSDKASLLLLEFIAAELAGSRLLVIGTYRDVEVSRQHPLSQTLGELTRQELFQRVLLRGLTQDDVGRFIEMVAGVKPPRDLVATVHLQTEGNPLFVTEVVRLLVQEGELTREKTRDSGTWHVRIPEGVREVIGRRLDRLSERCNQTLTIAAVIGRQFSLKQLDSLIEDMSGDRLLEVLEEALAARVIGELPRTLGHYQFTHALIQETLSEELSTTRRIQLHARIGAALEDLYGPEVEAHAAELAHHFAEAATVTGSDKLVRYSLLAGERALAAYAHEEALGYFERALAAKGVGLTGAEPAKDAEAAALLFGAGRAKAGALEFHRFSESVDNLGRAFDYYVEVGDVERAVSAVATIPLPPIPTVLAPMSRLVTSALALAPADSHNAGRLSWLRGRILAIKDGDYEGANAAFDQALSIARREKDTVLEMRTLADSAQADFHHLNGRACLEKSLRAINLAREADKPDSEIQARFWASMGAGFIGDLQAMRLHANAMPALGEKVRHRVWSAAAFWVNELVASSCGEWQAAREFSDRGLTIGPHDRRLLGTRAIMECQVGEFVQAQAYSERLVEAMRLAQPGPTLEYTYCALAIPVVASFTGDLDQLDIAREAAEIVISSSATPNLVAGARSGLAVMAVLQSDTDEAGRQYAALRATRGTVMRNGSVTDRLLGQLTHTMGRLDEAQTHFEDALTFCRNNGYRPDFAGALCDYADMLLDRNGDGDRDKATAMLNESLAISSKLGMRPLMERVLARKDILKA